MFISVEFGYQQKRLFNIECKTAPLVDAINDGCYADIAALLKKQKDYFTNELNQMKKKEENLQKKLKIEEEKPEDVPPPIKSTSPSKGGKNKDIKDTGKSRGSKQVIVKTINENPMKKTKKEGKKKQDLEEEKK